MVPQTLYHIREEHLSILQQLEENNGELTPELETALSLTQEQFQEKAVSYGFVVKYFDTGASVVEAEIKRLQQLQEKLENKGEMFRQRLEGAMHQFGVEKIETPTLKISFRKSEVVEIIEADKLPATMLDIVPQSHKINKTKIKAAIKAGEDVPGAALVTRQNLQIK